MHSRLLSALILLIFLTACTPTASTPTADPATAVAAQAALATMVASTLSPSATPIPPTPTVTAPPPTPTPTQKPPDPRPHYKLDIVFSYADHYGKLSEEIAYTNRTGEPLNDLRLDVELFSYPGLASITDLRWADGSKIENTTTDKTEVRIPLAQPLQPGQNVGLKLNFEFALPSQPSLNSERPLPIGFTARQANLVDWYPYIPPYRSGLGWLSHPPAYYGEHLVYEVADFDVSLRLADARSDLIIAASAPAKTEGDTLRYSFTSARGFAASIGSEYETETARVGNVTITSYYFPLNAPAGKRALQTTVEALKLYQELFGPYPHSTLAVVEADFYDGMEYDGLYFLSRAFYNLYTGQPTDYLVAIAAHETAHQWWYGVVGSDQANEPWLDEALCTYTERLYYERYYPSALSWWWAYRIDYYHPTGWVDTSVYNPQGILQTYQDYRNAVYLNGAHFFEDLRKTTGDKAFFAFLKDYTTRYAGQVALSSDFFALLRQHTTADLTPVLKKYFANSH